MTTEVSRATHSRRALPLLDAVYQPGAQVLPHVGGHREAVGGGGDLQQAVKLVGGGKARQEQHAVAVDDKLHHHAAHGDDGVLQAMGKPSFSRVRVRIPVGLQIAAAAPGGW